MIAADRNIPDVALAEGTLDRAQLEQILTVET